MNFGPINQRGGDKRLNVIFSRARHHMDGCSLTVRYWRIGTHGRIHTKTFDTNERTAREAEKLTSEKLRKGYRDA